ncbi:MAG: DUF2782 domain-containing protein [Gammaproteobacteria bacterium]|nr:DUF2782 domain-containing protein [Gammaproteobacteria bacterium]
MPELIKPLVKRLLAGGLLLVAGVVAAEDQVIDAPPPPPPLTSGEPLEPEVTIRRTPQETVYEYRRNGQLFLVRVQPRVGPPYHFVDVDGDGQLDYRPGEPAPNTINQWILFRW